ncbi:MAG: c-type cytochrome [Candidatus Poribacteria bacterium]|nr:c-type cytochrome [Candidatus Poribacteria bacterium]
MRSKKEIPAENKSYSVLFFILAGLLGLVTIWGFWDEMITRRPWKEIQQQFYQYEYVKTKAELENAKQNLPDEPSKPEVDKKQLANLEKEVNTKQVALDEAMQERKFEQSKSDAINYKYQHSLHEAHGKENETVKKWKEKLDEFEKRIEGELTSDVLKAEAEFADANKVLADFYQTSSDPENALSTYLIAQKYKPEDTEIVNGISTAQEALASLETDKAQFDSVARLQEKLADVGGIKRNFLGSLLENPFRETRTIVQYYLEEFNYTADRCETCHFAVDKSGYESEAEEIFEVEGDGENDVKYQLKHPKVKVGSEIITIDGFDAGEDEYKLSEDGLLTFTPDVFGEVEISYKTDYHGELQTHPERDVLLAKHPLERFGCTPCHGGQGHGLTAKAAHALTHAEYWLTPVLGMERVEDEKGKVIERTSEEKKGYMESNCRRCHDGVMKLDFGVDPETNAPKDFAPNLTKGMALFEDLGCHGCHAVEGYSALDKIQKVGPSLEKVGSKVKDIAWLENWIKKPEAYLPNTTMPNFFPVEGMSQLVYFKNGGQRTGLVTETETQYILKADDGTEYKYAKGDVVRIVDEVKSIAKYLAEEMKDQDLDGPQGTYSKSESAIKAGEETVKTVGCLSCHAVDGLDKSNFAPALDSVGTKVTPTYLRQWIDNPKAYDPDTAMPSLRLSNRELDNVVAYLMNLQKDTPLAVSNSIGEADVDEGKKLVRTYGCFGCHEIPGFENESKVGADLGEFGAKMYDELDFGDTLEDEVGHSWHDWTIGKITNPRRYQTRRIVSRMPIFKTLQDNTEDAKAIAVLLKSFQPEKYPLNYIFDHAVEPHRVEKQKQIDAGRRVVKRYNCTGCHEIEGEGGDYRDVIIAHDGLDEITAKQLAPPPLQAQGARVYPDWLFNFLKDPSKPIRYGLKVRMPTFDMSDEEATTLVKYFSALDDEPFPYETLEPPMSTSAELRVGKQIFDELKCDSCHPSQGETIPAGSDKAGRPDLSLAKERLKADWLIDWMKDPQSFQRGTAMPQAWPLSGGQHMPVDGYADNDAEKQIRLVRDYLISLGR